MSLSCECDGDDGADWYYRVESDFSALNTKRARKCRSCGVRIAPGATVVEIYRYRHPSYRCNYIEESIYGDEVPLAPWFFCETCGGLHMSVEDLGFCCDIESNIAEQIKEYRQLETD